MDNEWNIYYQFDMGLQLKHWYPVSKFLEYSSNLSKKFDFYLITFPVFPFVVQVKFCTKWDSFNESKSLKLQKSVVIV